MNGFRKNVDSINCTAVIFLSSVLSLPSQFSVVDELTYKSESQIGVQTNSSKLYDQIYISSGIKVCMNAIKLMDIEHRRYSH